MFPVSDVIPPRRIPTVTIGLIVVNLGFFLYELQLGSTTTALPSLVRARGVIPVDFAWLSAFTSLFLHAGWVHAGSNALYLWLFGGSVEDAFGRAGFAATYLACGAAGALVHAATHPWSAVPLIGASAAVGGVEAPAVFFLGIWFVVQLFADAGSIVAAAVGAGGMWAHLAGLVTGAICGAWSRFGRRSLGRWWR
jgi:membrane associated rhomboid family serine protease